MLHMRHELVLGLLAVERAQLSPGFPEHLHPPPPRAEPRIQQEKRFHVDFPPAEDLPFLIERSQRYPDAVLQLQLFDN